MLGGQSLYQPDAFVRTLTLMVKVFNVQVKPHERVSYCGLNVMEPLTSVNVIQTQICYTL